MFWQLELGHTKLDVSAGKVNDKWKEEELAEGVVHQDHASVHRQRKCDPTARLLGLMSITE